MAKGQMRSNKEKKKPKADKNLKKGGENLGLKIDHRWRLLSRVISVPTHPIAYFCVLHARFGQTPATLGPVGTTVEFAFGMAFNTSGLIRK